LVKKDKLCIVGLGYVGLPLAVQFAQHFSVIGFDVKKDRIAELKAGHDHTLEVSDNDLASVQIEYTDDSTKIREAKFIIVAVPTPIKAGNLPDMSLVIKASETVGRNMSKDSVVVYESTVYPGATEEDCIPVLEKMSGMKCGADFKIGYSPERVNPGDKEHTINKVVKVVSGMDAESADLIEKVYGVITKTHKASSIKVAEAAKVIENTQRDLNVALVNELAMIFQQMNISVYDVLEAAGTKWNFLKFTPGLVGGHCIGVDPYYLTYKAEALGHHPEVILAGRKINDSMGRYIARRILKLASRENKISANTKVVILGVTFKENVPDIRNSKVLDIYNELCAFGLKPVICDPTAEAHEVKEEYGLDLVDLNGACGADILIVAVAHDEFKSMPALKYAEFVKPHAIVADVKHILNKTELEKLGLIYWCL
jgi:UDP-N-acetyl-D-galactosamine dehydrogenase